MRPLPGGLAGAPGRRAIVGANDSALPHKSGCPLPGAPGATFGGFRGALSSRNGLLGPQAAGLGKHTLTPCVFILCTGGFIVLISLAKLPTSAPESTVSGEIVLRDRNFCTGGHHTVHAVLVSPTLRQCRGQISPVQSNCGFGTAPRKRCEKR